MRSADGVQGVVQFTWSSPSSPSSLLGEVESPELSSMFGLGMAGVSGRDG